MHKSFWILMVVCVPWILESSLVGQEPSALEDWKVIVKAHSAAVDSFVSLSARVVTRFQEPEGLTKEERAFFAKQLTKYEYRLNAGQEYLKIIRDLGIGVGEFTGNKYRRDTIEILNGDQGYSELKYFDGTLDSNGSLPIDSPAVGVIGDRKSGPIVVLAKVNLGFEVFDFDKQQGSLRLENLLTRAQEVRLVGRPGDESAEGCYCIDAQFAEAHFRIWLDPATGFAIRKCIGKFTENEYAIEYSDYSELGSGLFLPKRFLNTQKVLGGQAISMHGVSEFDSINDPSVASTMTVNFPRGLPFLDSNRGRSGIWGDGQPEFLFEHDDEAIAWDRARKEKALAKTNAASKTTYYWRFGLLAIVICIVLGLLGTRGVKKPETENRSA